MALRLFAFVRRRCLLLRGRAFVGGAAVLGVSCIRLALPLFRRCRDSSGDDVQRVLMRADGMQSAGSMRLVLGDCWSV